MKFKLHIMDVHTEEISYTIDRLFDSIMEAYDFVSQYKQSNQEFGFSIEAIDALFKIKQISRIPQIEK